MAIFTEKSHAGGEPDAGLSIIGTGMRVEGDVSADGVVKVEGSIVGTIRAARQVLVAKGGLVEGDILTREAIVGGEVRGGIQATERVELQATSVVHGDITTRRLFVQEGGEINGILHMGPEVAEQPEGRVVAGKFAAQADH